MIEVHMADGGTVAKIIINQILSSDRETALTQCKADAEQIYTTLGASLPQATFYQIALLFARRERVAPEE